MSHEAKNEQVIDQLVNDISDDIIKTSRIILKTEDINFTGGLSDKISKYKIGEFKYVVYDSPYAELVEDGMPPGGYVDIAKLREWVRKKVGITDERALGVVTGNIFNKIRKEGIEPKRFLDKSLDYVINRWGFKKSVTKSTRKTNTVKSAIRAVKTVTKTVNKINKLVKRSR